MARDEQPVVLGRINGLFGVHGFVKLYSYTEPLTNILDYDHWLVRAGDDWQRMRVVHARPQGKTLVAQLADPQDDQPITTRERAALLVDADLAVARAQLPAPPDGQHYWADLVGLTVRTREDIELGAVTGLMDTGAHAVLVVRGAREHLIPLVRGRYVQAVDPAAGTMIVDWDPDF